jgi:hypothetical protein
LFDVPIAKARFQRGGDYVPTELISYTAPSSLYRKRRLAHGYLKAVSIVMISMSTTTSTSKEQKERAAKRAKQTRQDHDVDASSSTNSTKSPPLFLLKCVTKAVLSGGSPLRIQARKTCSTLVSHFLASYGSPLLDRYL